MIEVKQIDVQLTYPIRKAILRKGMSLSHKMAGDEHIDSIHLGVYDGGRLNCVGSFIGVNSNLFLEKEQYQLRGMASAFEAQGKGYGKYLLSEAESILRKNNVKIIWCNARVTAVNFYKKMGYQVKGTEFNVPEVGKHFVMYKNIE